MIIFCDIDGTIFNNEHRVGVIPADRSHTANWHEFNALHIYDTPIQYRIDLLNALAMEHLVIYLTSRTDTFHDSTKAQLNMAKCPPGPLVMRGVGEHRPSAEFKVDAIGMELACRGLLADSIDIELAHRGISDAEFMLIDDDKHVCDAVASRYPMARVIKVPSQCCAYLAAGRALSLGAERAL